MMTNKRIESSYAKHNSVVKNGNKQLDRILPKLGDKVQFFKSGSTIIKLSDSYSYTQLSMDSYILNFKVSTGNFNSYSKGLINNLEKELKGVSSLSILHSDETRRDLIIEVKGR